MRAKLNCRLREPLSSLFPSLSYLSHVKPRLPPFTCQCIHNSELSALGCVGGESSSSLCQHSRPDLNRPDGTGWWQTGQTGVWICMCAALSVCNAWQRAACVSPLQAGACSSAGLAWRVAYVEDTVLELCPSLHLNALIHSALFWDLCMPLTPLLVGLREIIPLI